MPIRQCAKCGKIVKGEGVSFEGRLYHRECFVCSYCGGALTGRVVSQEGRFYHPECNPASGKRVCAWCRKPFSGRYLSYDERFYHVECYHEHVEKKCYLCGLPIKTHYYTDYWGHFVHAEHDGKPTRFCYSCGKAILREGRRLSKKYVLCSDCAATSVTTSAQVARCLAAVLALFKSLGITGVPEHIPIKLLPKDQMEGVEGRIYSPKGSRSLASQDFRIEINEGLPELHFQGVLAHELLHSWLRLYGREVTKDEKEGFCNLGCAFVYQKSGKKEAAFLLKSMFQSRDEVYGAGYRLMKARYERLGWAGLLDSLRR